MPKEAYRITKRLQTLTDSMDRSGLYSWGTARGRYPMSYKYLQRLLSSHILLLDKLIFLLHPFALSLP